MNLARLAPLTALLILLNGCALIPKQVEFFQRKVKAVPQLSSSAEEKQRQAADRLARDMEEAHNAAISENVSTNVTLPVQDASIVAKALSESLGPPYKPSKAAGASIAQDLRYNQAKLNAALQSYANHVDKDVGKKIEGTGLIHMSYFTYVGVILGLGCLAWFGIRIYGLANPVVGTAAGVIGRVSSSVLHRGFSEVVTGGQQFLQWVDNSGLEQSVKDWVVNAFKVAHQTQQSPDVQKVVDKLVTQPTSSTQPVSQAPVPAPSAPNGQA